MLVACPACAGRGHRVALDGRRLPCPDCDGRGRLSHRGAAGLVLESCPACKGDGRYASYEPDEVCPCCLGFGDVLADAGQSEAEERAA